MCEMLGNELGVVADAIDEARLAGALKVETERVEAGRVRDPAVVNDLASHVQHRHLQPWVLPSVAGGPKHGRDSGVTEVELGGWARNPNRRSAIGALGPHQRLIDEAVDRAENTIELLLRRVDVALEVAAEGNASAVHTGDPAGKTDALFLKGAEIDRLVVRRPDQLK